MRVLGIDHIVMAADTLDQGTDYIVETLGVRPQGGGEHVTMGTHNKVVRLGDDCYLEVIAINPAASKRDHPRWFELDTAVIREALRVRPRLITWAVRSDRIEELALKSDYPLGPITPMSRGNLHWRLTLTEDGHLPESGVIPFLIQWNETIHPATRMPDSGCRLASLHGYHAQPERLTKVLRSLGAEHLIEVGRPESRAPAHLIAYIQTPHGLRILA